MFGIQPIQTNIDQFRIALETGIYAAVIGGIIVGLLVWRLQLRYEKQRVRHEYERDYSTLEEEIRFALAIPHQADLADILTLPEPARTVVEILSKAPLSKLQENLPKREEVLRLFRQFLLDRSRFVSIATNLQQNIRGRIRYAAYEANLPVTEDAKYESFVLGCLLRFPIRLSRTGLVSHLKLSPQQRSCSPLS